MRLVQREQALGGTPRLRWKIVGQLCPKCSHFILSIRFTYPFPQGSDRHIQFIRYALHAVSSSLPGFAEGLLFEFS
jgi:hypothetical protein